MRRKTSHYFLDASPFHFRFALCTGFLCFLKVEVSCHFISYLVFFLNSGKFMMLTSKTYKNRLDFILSCFLF